MGPFETERLILRRFLPGDFQQIYALVYKNPDVYGMYSSIGGNIQAVRERFLHAANQPLAAEFGRLAVVLKEQNRIIGQIHLDPHVWTAPTLYGGEASSFSSIEVELAFAFGADYWGHGYAYEACVAMIDYAFLDLRLPRLVGGAMIGNARSVRLHQRLSFELVRNPNKNDPVGWITVRENDLLAVPKLP